MDIESFINATDDLLRICTLDDVKESLRAKLSEDMTDLTNKALKSLAGYVAGQRFEAKRKRRTPDKPQLSSLRNIYGIPQRMFNQEVRTDLDSLIESGLRECFEQLWVLRDLDNNQRQQFARHHLWCHWSEIEQWFEPADQLLDEISAHPTEDWHTRYATQLESLNLSKAIVDQALLSLARLRKQTDDAREQTLKSAINKLHSNLTVSDLKKLAESEISLYEVQERFHRDLVARKCRLPEHVDTITLRSKEVISLKLLPFEPTWDAEGYSTAWDDPDDAGIRWNGSINSQALMQIVRTSGEIEVLTWRILPRDTDGAELPSKSVFEIWERIWSWQKWRMKLADEVAQSWRLRSACQSVIQVCVYPNKTIRAMVVPNVIPGHNVWGLFPPEGYVEETGRTIARMIESLTGTDVLQLPESTSGMEYVTLYLAFCANAGHCSQENRPTFRSRTGSGIEIRNRYTDAIIFSDNNAWDLKDALRRAGKQRLDLREANLREANLRGAKLSLLDLHDADLSRAVLSGSKLTSVTLCSADLSGADLAQSELFRVDLSHSNLTGAVLSQSALLAVNLQNARVQDARMSQCKLDHKTNCENTNFANTNLGQTVFERVNCRGANFSHAYLCQTNFKRANCEKANFDDSSLSQAQFDYARLNGASFNECLRESNQVSGRNADLTGTRVRTSKDGYLEQ